MTARKPLLLRLEPEIRDALKRWADDDLRSLNAQIEWLLRERLRLAGRLKKKKAAGRPAPGAAS